MDIRIVLIPGAKSRIDEVLERYGIKTRFHDNLRISTEESIPFIKMAAFDVSNRLMTQLTAFRVNAVIGNWVRARSLGVIDGVDFQHTGLVDRIDVDLVNRILDEGIIPVFPCIGWNSVGRPYNISSNELAAVVSRQLKADKLFFMTDFEGYLRGEYTPPEGSHISPEGRISRMSAEAAESFMEMNSKKEHMDYIVKARQACIDGTDRVHILDGRIDGAIMKEIFSSLGVGTMVHTNIYEAIRSMKREDIVDVLRLMEPFIESGNLLRRTETQLLEEFADFVVYEMDGSIHGCGSLKIYDGKVGEIAGIAVAPNFAHLGIGGKIVSFLMQEAVRKGLRKVFALTTRTSDWFEQLGFLPASRDILPRERPYDSARNSLVFVKDIHPGIA